VDREGIVGGVSGLEVAGSGGSKKWQAARTVDVTLRGFLACGVPAWCAGPLGSRPALPTCEASVSSSSSPTVSCVASASLTSGLDAATTSNGARHCNAVGVRHCGLIFCFPPSSKILTSLTQTFFFPTNERPSGLTARTFRSRPLASISTSFPATPVEPSHPVVALKIHAKRQTGPVSLPGVP
jgi:hypothetical protein